MTFDIKQLMQPESFDHEVDRIELIETHISWVILTGRYAYKIKKPVDFGFLDFSTLDKRRRYCEQEVRLNRRLAPSIYLGVVPVTESAGVLAVDGQGDVIEYAVRMKQFPQSAQLDHMLQDHRLSLAHMDAIAAMLAEFHRNIDVADSTMAFGTAASVYQPVEENFEQVHQHLDTQDYDRRLAALAAQVQGRYRELGGVIEQRKRDGYVRQCHGDMHLRNMLWLDTDEYRGPMAFDCIEFNDNLSWIDVISEVAFLVMDLQSRDQYGLANRFLNSYLQATGDYQAVQLLSFYQCYRAMVRAKVSVLRLEQEITAHERDEVLAEFESYLELAESYTRRHEPVLLLMHGLSASGKSTVSQDMVDNLAVIRIRSDVERKRMFDVDGQDHSSHAVGQGLYSPRASVQTYQRLLELSASLLNAGMSAVVDAAFLRYDQRLPFLHLARELAVPCRIIDVTASHDTLRRRIGERENDVSDANLAVLEAQIVNQHPFHEDERPMLVTVDTEAGDSVLSKLAGLVTER